ncbi:MAG: DUF1592 domain-containing protein [Pirellulaceae bacterium]
MRNAFQLPLLIALLTLILATRSRAQAPAVNPKPAPKRALADVYRDDVVPLVKKFCLDCHGPSKQESEVAFHKYKTVELVAQDEKTWKTVIDMLRTGAMPPDDKPQPSQEEREKLIRWIEGTIYHVDCDAPPDPGRVTIRRLNRAEYNNTVRDLLGVDFKPADDFPSDDVGSGFDNIGDVLSLPPLLMEKYLAAAETIAEKTILATPPVKIANEAKEGDALRGEGAAELRGGRWAINSAGGVTGEFTVPRAGEYALRAVASGDKGGGQSPELEMQLDGKKVKIFSVNAPRDKERPYEIRQRLTPGKHALAARFINDFYDKDNKDPKERDRNLYVHSLEISGPLDIKLEEYPASHRNLIQQRPGDNVSVREASEKNLRFLLSRAFRRKATDDEIRRFTSLVKKSVARGDSFEQAMQVALTGVLVSPHFLFRVERDPKPDDSKTQHELADYELASRLSYFLWSSLPDNELFADATNGNLTDERILTLHVRRLLKDPRSDALVQNFAMQWLNLRLLDAVTPDPKVFPGYSPELKADMRRETELFVQAVIQEDRSILDFIDGDFTFVNERLAKHYGILSIFGNDFRRVSIQDGKRAGVLTHASVLTLTSNPGRTSPVKRGKWVLENILGSPPPDPPPDIPSLEVSQKASPEASLRQQLEIHRQNAVCASCHKTMDAIGFGLENYDGVGRWREKDGKLPIDSSAKLPSGEKFQTPAELVQVLKKRKRDFARCLSEKLLTYALGRGLMYYDRCAVDKIVDAVEKDNYRFSTLVVEIVKSEPFRKRRGDGGKP